jgi:hypothetical protein
MKNIGRINRDENEKRDEIIEQKFQKLGYLAAYGRDMQKDQEVESL